MDAAAAVPAVGEREDDHHHHHRDPETGHERRGRGISLLVPFRSDGAHREEVWEWLRQYWEHELPEAEIVMGCDEEDDKPFSKTAAVNDAARHAHGDIFVILDADCYIHGDVITDCAYQIRETIEEEHRLWFVPYRRFYRLTEDVTETILESDPEDPYWPPVPIPRNMLEDVSEKHSSHGHWFAALIQVMPREAFELVGGMDFRFRDWGGEDVSFMRAVDTLYARHHTTNNDVYHLWHPTFGDISTTRHWDGGQARSNDWLSDQYTAAIGDRQRMRELVDEGRATPEQ